MLCYFPCVSEGRQKTTAEELDKILRISDLFFKVKYLKQHVLRINASDKYKIMDNIINSTITCCRNKMGVEYFCLSVSRGEACPMPFLIISYLPMVEKVEPMLCIGFFSISSCLILQIIYPISHTSFRNLLIAEHKIYFILQK